MKSYLFSTLLVISQFTNTQEWSNYLHKSGNEFYEQWNSALDHLEDFSETQKMDILGTAVRIKANDTGSQLTKGSVSLGDRAIALLLVIPGHANYYGDRVIEAQIQADSTIKGIKTFVYLETRSSNLSILSQLPSPETIRVLGEFLADERPEYFNFDGAPQNCPLGWETLIYIEKLPLADPPIEKIGGMDEGIAKKYLPPWQKWYAEIKAGRRSFRFIGQTEEYRFRPDGTWETTQLPISVLERDKKPGAPPTQPPSTVRTEKRGLPDPAAATKTIAAHQVSIASRYALPALGLVTLLLGAWYFLRGRKVS